MRSILQAVYIAAGLAAAWLPPASAAERIEYRVPAGLTFTFETSTDTAAILQMQMGGQSIPVQQQIVQAVSGRVEVLAVAEGVPSRARVAFEPASATRTTMNGESQSVPFALAGKTVEVTVTGERIVGIVGPDGQPVSVDDAAREFVSDVVALERAMLPPGAVDVGDTWRADLSRENRALAPKLTMRIAGFAAQDGRRVARVDATAVMSGTTDGLDMSGEMAGPIAFDLETGLPVSSQLTGVIEIGGVLQGGNGPVTVSGSQRVTVTSKTVIGAAVATRAVARDSAPGTEARGGWKAFKHSSGATFSHPPDWRAQEYPTGVSIQPADAREGELIIASGAPADGTTNPASPEVGNYLDGLMWQTIPGVQRTAAPVAVKGAKGPGALYRYSGMLPDGRTVACVVYVTIERGTALTLSAVAAPDVLATRSATLEQIFGTLALGAPAQAAAPGTSTPTGDDPRLVGMFAGEALAGGGSRGAYVNTQLVSVLNADGTVYYGAQSHFNASQRDIDGNLRWSATGNTGQDVESGRWSASNGMLTIRWDQGGVSVYAYGFEPDGTLVLRDPTTRELINFYSRVQ